MSGSIMLIEPQH